MANQHMKDGVASSWWAIQPTVKAQSHYQSFPPYGESNRLAETPSTDPTPSVQNHDDNPPIDPQSSTSTIALVS
jgi:hypothetical protein